MNEVLFSVPKTFEVGLIFGLIIGVIIGIISFLIRDDINFNGLVVNIILCLCFIFSGIITYVYGFRKNINL